MLTLPDTLENTGYRISASLFDDVPERLRGHLDIVDPEIGVEGWALNLDAPDEPVTLELLVRGCAVEICNIRQDDNKYAQFARPQGNAVGSYSIS